MARFLGLLLGGALLGAAAEQQGPTPASRPGEAARMRDRRLKMARFAALRDNLVAVPRAQDARVEGETSGENPAQQTALEPGARKVGAVNGTHAKAHGNAGVAVPGSGSFVDGESVFEARPEEDADVLSDDFLSGVIVKIARHLCKIRTPLDEFRWNNAF